jgi:hypothetical protein
MSTMTGLDTPLFVKTHDFILWLLKHSMRFPKALRHTFTNRLEQAAFDFQQATLMANAVRGEARMKRLDQADGHLSCLRSLLRFTTDLQLLGAAQVKYASDRMDELGRLLGAWKKGTDRQR